MTSDTAEVTRITVDTNTNTKMSIALVEHSNSDKDRAASRTPSEIRGLNARLVAW